MESGQLTGEDVAPILARHPELVRLGGRPALGLYLRQLWGRREFALTVPLGELRAQHMDTALGNAWHVLNPLLQAGVYYLIFGVVLNARADVPNYPAFLVIGLSVYFFTQKSIMGGARTIVANLRLIQSLTFPRAILPVAAALREAVAQVPVLVVLLAFVLLTGARPAWAWLLIVPAAALQVVFNVGAAFIAGRATFHFRDMEQILPFLLRLWFYMSGVFFTVERIPEGWPRRLFEANPIYSFIELARELLLGGGAPLHLWIRATAWSAAVLVAGFLFFQREEGEYGRGW